MAAITAKHHRESTTPRTLSPTPPAIPAEVGSSRNRATQQSLLLERTFAPEISQWFLKQMGTPFNKETLQRSAELLAQDLRLKVQLANPNDEHTMTTVIRRCVELNLDIGTKNLRTLHKALQMAGLHCDRVTMTLDSFVLLSASSSHPSVKALLGSRQFADSPKEDRFMDLVSVLEKNKLLGTSQNLADIFSGLPKNIKKQTTQIKLSLAELKALRTSLDDIAVKQLVHSPEFLRLSKEDRFVTLVLTLEEKKLLGKTQNLTQIYSGLPAELKKEVLYISLSLAELKALRANLEHPAVKEFLNSTQFQNLSKEDRFIELVLTLEKNSLLRKSSNLREIHSGLPAELKNQLTHISLPLTELKALRTNLEHPAVKDLLNSTQFKNLSREDRFMQLVITLAEKGLIGASVHLGEIHSGLPAELKKELKGIHLTLAELRTLRADLEAPAVKEFLSSPEFKQLSKADRFIELVYLLQKNGCFRSGQHLGHIYSGLPADLKKCLARINLPLAELKDLRKNLENIGVIEFLTSPWFEGLTREDRFVELVFFLERNKLLGTSQHLGNLFSGLPVELKKRLKIVDLPLAELKELRTNLESQDVVKFLESPYCRGLPKNDRFAELILLLERNNLLGKSRNPAQIYSGLPTKYKKQLAKIDLPFAELKSLRASLENRAVREFISSTRFLELSKEDRMIDLVSVLRRNGLVGTNQHLGHIYSALPAELKKDLAKIDLPLSELTALRKNLDHPAVKQLLSSPRFIKLSREDRFIKLIFTLEKEQLLGKIQNLRQIYSGLPTEYKKQLACISLPLAELKALRTNLKHPAVQEFFNSAEFQELSKEDRFMKLVMILEQKGLIGTNQNLAEVYSGLPARHKRRLAKIALPMAELKALRKNLEHPAVKEFLNSDQFRKICEGDRFIELVLTLEKGSLLGKSQNLGDIYSGLPAELKKYLKCTTLPLAELKALRENLTHPAIRQLLSSSPFKELSREDRFVKLVCMLEENKLLGSSQNLAQLHSGLPAELKTQLANINLPLAELKALRKNLESPVATDFLNSPQFEALAQEDRFIELVLLLERNKLLRTSQHLGNLFSGLPEALKRQLKIVKLPLAELKQLRTNLKHPAVEKLLSSPRFQNLSREERFIDLVLALEEQKLLGSSQNLGNLYSGLPVELKEQMAKIDIPLAELKLAREFLALKETNDWIEKNLKKYPKEERLQVLRARYADQSTDPISRRQFFYALPQQLSESCFKRDLTTTCSRLVLPEQTVFFDSSDERIVAQLLFKYGLITTFVPGRNLHVRTGDSKSTLDFKIGNTFLEYHPLSRRDRERRLTLESAGDLKRSRLDHDKFPGHNVIHIWKLKQLYELLAQNLEFKNLMKPEYRNLTLESFIADLREAKAYGHKIDRGIEAAQRLPI